MTRVVIVAGTYRPERCGTAHYVQRLRHALDERGVSSYVLTAREAARASEDPGVRGAVRGWGTLDLPELVVAVDELPRTAGGKLLRRDLRATLEGAR